MQIQDCFKGQRVTYRENGKVATIKNINLNKNEIEIEFDSGMGARVQPRLLEPSAAGTPTEAPRGPRRPCPRCAATMPPDSDTCPACGFQYGGQKSGGMPGIVKLIILLALAGIGFVLWNYFVKK